MTPVHDAYVGIGSNIQPERHLRIAVSALEECYGVLRCSDVFRSPAFGFDGDDFLNMVVGLTTKVDADAVEQCLSGIEYAGGRRRQAARYVPRTLDLDLLLFGGSVDPGRRLPRNDVLRFPFVLAPLAELAPTLPHPLTGMPLQAAWQQMAVGPLQLKREGALGALDLDSETRSPAHASSPHNS